MMNHCNIVVNIIQNTAILLSNKRVHEIGLLNDNEWTSCKLFTNNDEFAGHSSVVSTYQGFLCGVRRNQQNYEQMTLVIDAGDNSTFSPFFYFTRLCFSIIPHKQT